MKKWANTGWGFSTIEQHILDVLPVAENNEKDVEGLAINAFSEPCMIDKELFEQIRKTGSILEEEQQED